MTPVEGHDPSDPQRIEEPVTAEPDPAEPTGEQRTANEAEIEEATKRSDAVDRSEVPVDGSGPATGPTGPVAAPGPEQPEAAPGDDVHDEESETVEAEDELSRLRREREHYLAVAQRAQADFENYRKRAAREAAAAGERAKSGLVRELLPVVDNLERALDSAGEDEQHLAEGVRLVHHELIAVLQRNGVEQFDPQGQSFDPGLHEALSVRSEEGAQSGVVLDVVEKGYKANGAVLRPARVVVSG